MNQPPVTEVGPPGRAWNLTSSVIIIIQKEDRTCQGHGPTLNILPLQPKSTPSGEMAEWKVRKAIKAGKEWVYDYAYDVY